MSEKVMYYKLVAPPIKKIDYVNWFKKLIMKVNQIN